MAWAATMPITAGTARLTTRLTAGVSCGATTRGQQPRSPADGGEASELDRASGGDAPGQRKGGGVEPRREKEQGRDHDRIEEHRHGGSGGESSEPVQHASQKLRQRGEQHEGQHDAHQQAGERKPFRIACETGRQYLQDQGRRQCNQRSEQHQRRCRCREHPAGKVPGGGGAATRQPPGEHGDEGRADAATGEQAAHKAGDLERNETGVGLGAGAEKRSDRRIAYKAEQAAARRQDTDADAGAQQVHRRDALSGWTGLPRGGILRMRMPMH